MNRKELKTSQDYAGAAIGTMMRKYEAAKLPPVGRFHYHQGVFLSGVYQNYLESGDEAYFTYLKDWVDAMMDEEGNLRDWNRGWLDDIQPGINLFPLYERTGEAKYRAALDHLMDALICYPKNERGVYWHKEELAGQLWLDGLYMSDPFVSRYAYTFSRPEYYDIPVAHTIEMRERTRDDKTGLWYHACDQYKKEPWADPETGCSPEFWGRSIAWMPVAILDVLDVLPKEHPGRPVLTDILIDLLESVCRYQSDEGRWYQVVDKGGWPGNWLENSCSCLFAAALFKGVRTGLLPPSYLEKARKAYASVTASLTMEGEDLMIGQVCVGTGVGDYAHYCARPVGTNDLHGVGAFLLMCAEETRTAQGGPA